MMIGNRRYRLFAGEHLQIVHELLRSTHRERRNEHPSAARRRLANDAGEMIARGCDALVIPIPVRRFHDHDVSGVRRRHRIANDRQPRASDVSREDQTRDTRSGGGFDHHGCRPQNVPRVHVAGAHAVADIEPFIVRVPLHELFRARRVSHAIERRVDVAPVSAQKREVALLDVRTIGEHDRAEIGCRLGRMNRFGIAVAHEKRQATGVIEVRMREHDGIDLVRLGTEALGSSSPFRRDVPETVRSRGAQSCR